MDPRIISRKLQLLQELAVEFSSPVEGWQVRKAQYQKMDEYRYDGPWEKTPLPARIPAGRTAFFKTQVAIPAHVALPNAYLCFRFQDMEGLLSIDGKPYAGIDWAHLRVPIPKKGRLNLGIEFMSVQSFYRAPELAGQFGVFSEASVQTVNRLIEGFCYDIRFAWETTKVITDSRRKPLLDSAIEEALLAVDLTLPRPRLLEEVGRARRILRQKISAIAPDPESGAIYAVGHTHIDTAWLWPLRETVRKCGRTFSTACRLMEQYPDFRFTCSQPQLYQYTKQYFPDLYRQIRQWVKTGRWETAGAMWVEPDCNATSGESLIRQMLYGIKFFHEEFGTRPRMCWLPDVFGYPSSLPEILAGCGVKYFYTYKLHWQVTNPFPHHLFRWRGIDGTEVLAHVVNHLGAYNNFPSPEVLSKGWAMYAQKTEHPEVILPFGYGDGGGGVNEEMMEMFRRAEGRFPGLPAVRIGTAEDFFDEAEKDLARLPVWDGELYVETHRGTYTTHSAMKRANRHSELLLRQAEILGSLTQLTGGRFDAQTLHDAWEWTLLHQFHDILPGSSIGMVYTEALPVYSKILDTAERSVAAGLQEIIPGAGKPPAEIGVFNALSWPRTDVVTAQVPAPHGPLSIEAPDQTRYPVQVIARQGDRATIAFQAGAIPSCGYALFHIGKEPATVAGGPLEIAPNRLENRFYRMELGRNGEITRLIDKRYNRDVLVRGAVGNDLQLMQDGPEREDAWNVHATNDKRRYPFEGATSVKVVETGPVRGVVRVKRIHRKSTLEQDIVIYADMDRIDFVTRVDWQERQTMLKVAFPLDIRCTRAAFEVQFGAYERPTHRNTSLDQQKFEVPAQRWADLSEAGYGVSLLNDSRYGYDVKDNVLRLTLLRSTTWPDPEADRGQHEFTYSLLPHRGGWTDGETVRRAWELNVPARSVPVGRAAGAPRSRSFLSLEGAPAVLETLKPAEDGRGLILRVYESHGSRGEVSVLLDGALKQVLECNHVEEDGSPIPLSPGGFRFPIRPFQIRSFRLLMSKG
jgi:alpha-mannosidase